ncbi:amine oxidase [Ceratobasidium sp. AG-I]|nr:amine oxidase [Ceratobasidium sp. AG-I]
MLAPTGASGLYAALILQDLGIPYQIIEAQDKVGGRLFTHKFPDQTGAPYNYFDVGAMRFPKISSMERVFKLFEYPPLNTGDIALKAKLKPFYFIGGGNNNTYFSYNGVTIRQNAMPAQDPFKADQAITDDIISPFATRLLDDLKNGGSDGWKYMKEFDLHSTRSYMALRYTPSLDLNIPKNPLPNDVINWCETFDKSTGWYDRALSETVLEAVAFGWHPGPHPPRTQWFCVDGGAHEIAESMAKYIRSCSSKAINLKSPVSSIAMNGDSSIDVVVNDTEHHQFAHVITTIPLPVLRTLDLSNAGLSVMQLTALRELNYGPSVKVGLQFKTAWWTTGKDRDGIPLNIVGGQTYTDGPLRTVVYPSFGNVQDGETTTLIASYCWTEDATRLGALIDHKDNGPLRNLMLRELARIHNVTIDFLTSELIDMKAWSWSHNPYSMGAFAFFGPGKFENLYTTLNTPAANGHLHFAGEAISVRHAWVEGALDSAWKAVYEILAYPEYESYQTKFFKNWGINAEWIKTSQPSDAHTIPKSEHNLIL